MSGSTSQQQAADDRELERILSMTDAEIIASVGGDEEAERIAKECRELFERAVVEAERRTGGKYGGPKP